MTKIQNRAISWIVLFVFSFVIFASSCFIITHADHDCTGNDCPVCIELAQCSENIHTSNTASVGTITLAMLIFALCAYAPAAIRIHCEHTTLISLKVELLN